MSHLYDYENDPDYQKTSAISYIAVPNKFADFKHRKQSNKSKDGKHSQINSNLLSSTCSPYSASKDSSYATQDILDMLTSALSKLPSNYLQVRDKANPYHFKSRFLNISALKLACIDSVFDVSSNVNTFLDLCSGPGGFIEYLFYKKSCKGYGITLKGPQDYMHEKIPGFNAFYGSDSSGDITKTENINSLVSFINSPVDLVLADGVQNF